MPTPNTKKLLVSLTICACLGLVPFYTVIQSFTKYDEVTAGDLADMYNKDVYTERMQVQSRRRPKETDVAAFLIKNGTRKVFLDCGANVASSVQLFKETYPGGRDYEIYSFEIDGRLAPYFSPYIKHHLYCPVGVASENGNVTAYLESVWAPNKGLNNGRDMQWGGGTLFANQGEIEDTETGGKRKLSTRSVIPTIDLARWIKETFSVDDYVILKLDVEGAEFSILQRMLELGTFKYIDKLYGEYHNNQPTGWSRETANKLVLDVGNAGFVLKNWEADRNTYSDFESIHPPEVPHNTPGKAGEVYSTCREDFVSLVVAIGMNHKRANKVVSTLRAYPVKLPITLFVHGDFVDQFPGTVKAWSGRFQIGIREDGHYSKRYLDTMPSALIGRSLVSSILRLRELGLKTAYYWPAVNGSVLNKFRAKAKDRGLRVVIPSVEFPDNMGAELTMENYYRYRDVERVPRALRMIHGQLAHFHGGILGLDSDCLDTYMISVFLMDYLTEASGFTLVDVDQCVRDHDSGEKGVHFDVWAH
ncbi:uncharacterized protein LOC117291402 [Asterias rubens]|uniref:uncharacterized protein LOC117291402 n=1 Tax=Asterias rubens TaxID=7604 RepID=UPI00145573C3|nr:uncharacterized protein LOC117291402 [Asterias rubens]